MSNTYPTQFSLLLPTAVLGTFPFFDGWYNVVKFTSIVFPFPLPIRVSSPPNGQVVVLLWSSLTHLLLVFLPCPLCAGTLHNATSFPWLWGSAIIPYIWFNIGWFYLLFSMVSFYCFNIFLYANCCSQVCNNNDFKSHATMRFIESFFMQLHFIYFEHVVLLIILLFKTIILIALYTT